MRDLNVKHVVCASNCHRVQSTRIILSAGMKKKMYFFSGVNSSGTQLETSHSLVTMQLNGAPVVVDADGFSRSGRGVSVINSGGKNRKF